MKISLRRFLSLVIALASALVGAPWAAASSAGRPYTLYPAPASNYPDSGGELTDGVTATGESWVNAAGWLYTNPTITVDLGQSYNLAAVYLFVGNSHGNGSFGVARPANISLAVSSDGVNFATIGNLDFSAFSDIGTKDQVDTGSAAVGATARWVRFAVTAGGPWVMVTELVVVSKGYAMSPPPASSYPDSGGELTDGVTDTGESWVNAAGWIYTNPIITWDFGQVHYVNEARLFVGNSHGNGTYYGVARPANVSVSVSSDGVSFMTVGNLSFSPYSAIGTKNQVDKGQVAVNTTARWVRFSVAAGGPWVMVTELAAW
jgi:hypothetical protein